jgi:hypothetical protein
VTLLTPVGLYVFGSVVDPGENRASGELEWSLGLVCVEEECQQIFTAVEDVLNEARRKDPLFPKDNSKLYLPFGPSQKKNEAGDLVVEDGKVLLKFKRKRLVKRRGEVEKTLNTPPRIYDSEGKMVQVPTVPRGSKGKAVFDIYSYNTPATKGVGFGLKGFQIVEMAEQIDDSLPPVDGGWRAESELDQLLASNA